MTTEQGLQGSAHGPLEVTVGWTSRPVITPDAFDGDTGWDEWISHFNSVSRVNEWNDQIKLLWLEVRLVGKARKVISPLRRKTTMIQLSSPSIDTLSPRAEEISMLPNSRPVGESQTNLGEN